MGMGWKKALCTSIRRDTTAAANSRPHSPSPRAYSRLKLFSSSSTPSTQLPQGDVITPTASLRCRTATSTVTEDEGCGNFKPPRTTVVQSPASSNPCSPRSPSRFSLLKNSLRLFKSRCGICQQSVKAVQGKAIFIAECSHSFHFPCIANHVRKQRSLLCPVCAATWCQVHLLSDNPTTSDVSNDFSSLQPPLQPPVDIHNVDIGGGVGRDDNISGLRAAVKQERVMDGSMKSRSKTNSEPAELVSKGGYSDDEPLLSPGGMTSRFNPIPEEDDEDEASENEFQGFFVTANRSPSLPDASTPKSEPHRRLSQHQQRANISGGGIEITVNPDVTPLSRGRNHDKYVLALKVKALSNSVLPASGICRAPIDMVMVLDVGGAMAGAKLQMLKRSICQVIYSLTPSDRLSLVAFSSVAKRLLPLRRMTPQGQRYTRRIVDRLDSGHNATGIAGDALKKAAQILEDRRECNPVASIILLADGQQEQHQQSSTKRDLLLSPCRPSLSCRSSFTASSAGTRFAHIEIPVTLPGIDNEHAGEPPEDAFARCISRLLGVIAQDVTLQLDLPSGEITAVCSIGCQPTASDNGTKPIRLGDLYADEERGLLVEIRVPSSISQFSLHANCNYRDPATLEAATCGDRKMLVSLPPVLTTNSHRQQRRISMSAKSEKIRNLFVTTRAISEARRLTRLHDTEMALNLLSSARALLLQSTVTSADENLRTVETELGVLQRRRKQRNRRGVEDVVVAVPNNSGGGNEALTPTSAWRAAEKLAKLAAMTNSLNRVRDLHGFEDARF